MAMARHAYVMRDPACGTSQVRENRLRYAIHVRYVFPLAGRRQQRCVSLSDNDYTHTPQHPRPKIGPRSLTKPSTLSQRSRSAAPYRVTRNEAKGSNSLRDAVNLLHGAVNSCSRIGSRSNDQLHDRSVLDSDARPVLGDGGQVRAAMHEVERARGVHRAAG